LDITPARLGFLIINKALSKNVNHYYRFSIKFFSCNPLALLKGDRAPCGCQPVS
jgi:hypothetical protein